MADENIRITAKNTEIYKSYFLEQKNPFSHQWWDPSEILTETLHDQGILISVHTLGLQLTHNIIQ